MQRALPWLMAVGALAFAAWSWTVNRDSAVAAAHEQPVGNADVNTRTQPTATREQAQPLRATQACLARLELAQAAVERCEQAGERSGGEQDLACLAESEVAAEVERRIAAAIEAHVEREHSREGRAQARLRGAFDEWSTKSLGILPHEREWLVQYVCAARELRERTLEALDELPPEQALEQLQQQREQILADLEQALGPDRYATLRTIGGIGLLADTTDCSAAG